MRNLRPVHCMVWLTLCVILSMIIHRLSRLPLPIFPSTSCGTGFLPYDEAFFYFLSIFQLVACLRNSIDHNTYVLAAAATAGLLNYPLGLFPASSCALLTWFLFAVAAAVFSLFVPNP